MNWDIIACTFIEMGSCSVYQPKKNQLGQTLETKRSPGMCLEFVLEMNMNLLRPLSPHLPIYKPQLTSTFSIFHRISGIFLVTIVFFFYLLYLKIGLICLTYENVYLLFFYSSKFILISVEMTALALSYHIFHGVRHLLTDFSGRKRWK